MAYFPLNFGSFCAVIQDVVPKGTWWFYEMGEQNKRQKLSRHDTVMIVFSLVYSEAELEHLDEDVLRISDNAADLYFKNRGRVSNDKFREHIKEKKTKLTDVIERNFRERIWCKLDAEQRANLVLQLRDLVNRLQSNEDPMNLRGYIGAEHYIKGENDRLCCRFVSKCLKFCLFTPNTQGETVKWDILNEVPSTYRKGDPYRLVSGDDGSTVVKWVFIDNRRYRKKREYYDYNLLTQTILRENLILTSVECGANVIEVHYQRFEDSRYQLRRLKGKKDAEEAREFIREHESEFQRKRSWRGRKLSDMAWDGLITNKWNAYGYFDPQGKLIAYLDVKIRIDGSAELGILLVDTACRQMGLASSLMFFYEIMFAPCRIFGGTYETNKKMRNTFLATGFVQIWYYNSKTKERVPMLKERINEDYPDDPEMDGNSVYFCAESLLTRLFRTTRELKQKEESEKQDRKQ